ncbi:DUF3592 domain-containing protein [Gammaproteobacteria bacterium]
MKTYFALMGIACIVFAVAIAFRRFVVWMNGVSTTGKITGHQALTTEDGVGYVPVVEFMDLKGTIHRFVSNTGDFPRRRDVGASVKVLYSQSNPGMAYICSFWHIWVVPITFAALGIILVVTWL